MRVELVITVAGLNCVLGCSLNNQDVVGCFVHILHAKEVSEVLIGVGLLGCCSKRDVESCIECKRGECNIGVVITARELSELLCHHCPHSNQHVGCLGVVPDGLDNKRHRVHSICIGRGNR